MSDSDLKDREETSAEALEKEHGDDFSADEKSKLDNLSGQVGSNDEIPFHEEGAGRFRLKGRFSRRQKTIGGMLTTMIVTALIAFLSLLPLKIVHIVESLHERFFSTSNSAVQRRAERHFSQYLKDKVFPGMGDSCRSTRRNKSCVGPITGNSPLTKLYKGWSESNLEGNLATKYGLEFERKDNVTTMRIKGEGFDVSDLAKGKVTELRDIEAVGRAEIRTKWMEPVKNETRLKQVMYRYKVGRLLERKYGIRRCLFACKPSDKFGDWKDKKKGAAVMYAERVLTARSEFMGLMFECVVTSTCDGPADKGRDGEKRDVFQKRMDEAIKKISSKYGQKTASKLAQEAVQYYGAGTFSQYVLAKVFPKLAEKEATKKAIPIIGQIDMVANLLAQAKTIGSKYKRWVYMTNSAAMVSIWMMSRSQADELKSGNVDEELLGSMTNTFSESAHNKGQQAENSPLYSNLMGGTDTRTGQSALSRLISPMASAASDGAASPGYTCDDGDPPADGKLICQEENLTSDNTLTKFSDQFKTQPLSSLVYGAELWKGTLGVVYNAVVGLPTKAIQFALDHFEPYKKIEEAFGKGFSFFLDAASKYLIKDPFQDMSGGRAFNMTAGGADVSGNFFAHFGLGSSVLTDAQVGAIRDEQENQARILFSQKPLYARLFDKEDSQSLVSKTAMIMPTNMSFFGKSLASLTNPFSAALGSFSSVFSGHTVHAKAYSSDPFGISQYGYALDNPDLTADPEKYTPEYCKDIEKDWVEKHQEENPDTAIMEHKITNPCRLEADTIASEGAMYTDAVLGSDDTTFNPGE